MRDGTRGKHSYLFTGGPLEVMTTIILFPVLHDHEEGIERLVSQTSLRFSAHRVLASAA